MIAEELLHFVWQFRLFNQFDLYNTEGEKVVIVQVGEHNINAGPDFLYCQLLIGDKLWVGHVEIHVDGRDWTRHGHDQDERYNNVILHVVYTFPIAAFRQDKTMIPTLVIKELLPKQLVERYKRMLLHRAWIPCAKQLDTVSSVLKVQVLQRMAVLRLEERVGDLRRIVVTEQKGWEYGLFQQLCRSFGTKVNADVFQRLAEKVDLTLVWKYHGDTTKLEAMFFGQAGFLQKDLDESYLKELQEEYRYLKRVHNLSEISAAEWKFLRMRPYNFPTYRLAQLAALYNSSPYIFALLLSSNDITPLVEMLKSVRATPFWQYHFNMEKKSPKHDTKLSTRFIEHLIINCFIPVLFAYGKEMGQEELQWRAFHWLEELDKEDNNIVRSFSKHSLAATNALDSQGLLHLKYNYCNARKCLQCPIGVSILRH